MGVPEDRTKAEEETQMTSPATKKRERRLPAALQLASWNVRTMQTGLSENLDGILDIPKTSILDRELKRLGVDVAALQETRLANLAQSKKGTTPSSGRD